MALKSGHSSAVTRAADSFCALLITGAAIYISGPHIYKPAVIQVGSRTALTYSLCAILFTLAWNKCVGMAGLYGSHKHTVRWVVTRSARVSLVMTIVLAPVLMLVPMAPRRGNALALFFVMALVYEVIVFLVKTMTGGAAETAIILGTGRRAQQAWRELRVAQHGSVQFLGFVDDRSIDTLAPDIRERYLTTIESLPAYLLDYPVDMMIVATSLRSDFDLTRNAIAVAEMFDVRVVCLEDRFELGRASAGRNFAPVLSDLVARDEVQQFRRAIKHAVDKAVAATLLTVLAPLFVLLFAVSMFLVDGPVLVWDPRYGFHRKRFQMLSLNTQPQVADDSFVWIGGSAQTRNTGVNRVNLADRYCQLLQITRFDKLPRLWNVLTGDMSLVGPQPSTTHGLSPLQRPEWADMFRARPGLLGPTSLVGSASRETSQIVALESSYVQGWTLRADIKLLGRVMLKWCGLRPVESMPWVTAPPAEESSSSV